MRNLFQHATCAVVTIAAFLAAVAVNEWLFRQLEFIPGVNWVYLPAGVRLLATLLFAGAGAAGLLVASWLVCFYWFFPDDPLRAFVGGVLATVAPYGVYLMAQRLYGLRASLDNLTPQRLLGLSLAYSLVSPALHHLWFALQGQPNLAQSFMAMFVGDLAGTLLVVYGAKALLAMVPPSPVAR